MADTGILRKRPPSTPDKMIWLWAFTLACLLPWFFIRIQQATNSDILWLCETLSRYLDGHKLSEAAYEVNPPLSMLLYILPVLAQKYLQLPLHYTIFIQTTLLTLMASRAVYRILSSYGFLDRDIVSVITVCFLMISTVGSLLFFGERDHIIGVLLLSFTLLQLSITYRWPRPRGWNWPLLVLGTIMILVKPHYGLLPSLLLLHRIYRQKNLSVLRHPDFLCLALGTVFYILSVTLIFPDYVSVIMPDAIRLYVPLGRWALVGTRIADVLAFVAVLSIIAVLLPANAAQKKIIFLFIAAGVTGLIPFYVQGLGFDYQLMPSLIFLAPAFGLTLLLGLKSRIGGAFPVFYTVLFVIMAAHVFAPLNLGYPRHQDYENLPLSQTLRQDCPKNKPCSFFMYNRDMGILHETAYYMHMHHASRFPSFWFLPGIKNATLALRENKPSLLTQDEVDMYFKKYSAMVTQDLAKDRPDLLFIWDDTASPKSQNFINYFSPDPGFRQEWAHYKKIRRISLRYSDYYKGAGTRPLREKLFYDVYRRVD